MIKTHITKILSIMLLMVMPMLNACKHHDPEPEPQPPTPQPEAEASRTVLVYMIATNNLSGDALDDLHEMTTAAQSGMIGDGRLLAYYVNYKGAPVMLEITKEGTDTLKTYDSDVVSLSSAHMRQVVLDAKELAPAKGYGMVMWGHATSWWQDGINEPSYVSDRLKSYGSDRSKWMNVTEMGKALRDLDLEFMYFDCCFMGAIEVLYELRDVAPVIVASPTEIKAEGMPYDVNVACFFEDVPNMVQAAKNYYEYYDYYYNNHDYSKDSNPDCPYMISAYDLTAIDGLVQATKDVYAVARLSWPEDYVPQNMYNKATYKFYDFDDYVKALCGENQMLYLQWREAFDKVVIFTAKSSAIWGTPVDRYGGMTSFIFHDETEAATKNYNTLSWYDDVAKILLK